MSTRAVYTFKDSHNTFHIYKHHDGYPSGAVQSIEAGFNKFNEEQNKTANFEACELATRFICANKDSHGGVYLSNGYDDHGDLEYRYEIIANRVGAAIWAFKISSGGDVEELIFAGSLEKFKEYIEQNQAS